MFADHDTLGAIWAAAVSLYPWVAWGAAIAAMAGAAWWIIRKLRSGDQITVIAGHIRRLLVKRTGASPAPPSREAPQEAGAPQEEAPTADTTKEPAPTGEAPPPSAPEAPRLPDAPMEEAPAWVTRALIGIAAVPTLLALPWAAWSVAQLLPVPLPVALPLGILFDVAMVGAVLVALLVPSVSRQASALGWVAAGTAAVAIAVHTGFSGALIFAVTPLISKALWGLLITIRRQQASLAASRKEAQRRQREAEEEAARRKEEAEAAEAAAKQARDAELSPELSFEQQKEIARLEREALYEEKLAAAQLKLSLAKSDAEHQKALAEIKRLGEQQRAEDKEEAEVYEQRLRLERKLRTIHGQAPRFALEPGVAEAEIVPEIAPVGITNKAGFGGGFGFSRPLDVKALTPEGATVAFEELPETHQALVKYVHAEKSPTVRGAARRLDRDARTIRRWKDRLSELGYELPIGD